MLMWCWVLILCIVVALLAGACIGEGMDDDGA
jgi:uncharacterized protein YneF (UPF0154 family)